MSFARCLASGRKAEDALERAMTAAGLSVRRNTGPRESLGGWDLAFSLAGKEYTLEVKNDLKAAVTGNIALEFMNTSSGRASGIMATTATLWCVAAGGAVAGRYLARSRDVRAHFASEPGRDVDGGDGNSRMRLYRARAFLDKLFIRTDDMTPEQLVLALSRLVA